MQIHHTSPPGESACCGHAVLLAVAVLVSAAAGHEEMHARDDEELVLHLT